MPQAPPRRPPGKQSILEAVYEDNRTVSEGPHRPRRRPPSRPEAPRPSGRRWLPFGLVLLAVVAAGVWALLRPAPAAPAIAREASGPDFDLAPAPRPLPTDADVADVMNLQVRTIVVDPGHGGHDPGAIGPDRLQEKWVTLDVARRLTDRLRQHGAFHVVMTREDDRAVSLGDRVALANDAGADLYVSIHVNALPDPSVAPVETYYFGADADASARQLAHAENAGSTFSVADFNASLRRAGTAVKLQESRELAETVQRALVERDDLGLDRADWGAKPAPFAVLLHTEAPAILAEITALSNPAEEARLRTPAARDAIAAALEAGVLTYLGRPLPSDASSTDGRQKEVR